MAQKVTFAFGAPDEARELATFDGSRKAIRYLVVVLTILICGWLAAPVPMVSATTIYDFTLIATSNTGTIHNLGVPSINDSGAVAFQASLTAGGYGVFTGSGGPLTTIVNSNDGVFNTFSLGAQPMINNAGTVAFFGQLNPGADGNPSSTSATNGLFTGAGGAITTIVLADGTTFSSVSFIPSINNSGVVAFQAGLAAGGQGIFTGDGTTTKTITTSTTNVFGNPDINSAGTVAYWERMGTFPGPFTFGVFRSDGTTTTTIAQTGSGFFSFGSGSAAPKINDDGTVAFTGVQLGRQGIYTVSGGSVTTVVDSFGTSPFSISFATSNFSLNDAGEVAFLSDLKAGGTGIFTGSDPINDKVIQTGDPLFGSTVANVAFHTNLNFSYYNDGGLNDNGALAFFAQLSDGRQVIAVATPERAVPEPSTILLLGAGLAGVGLLRRRFKR